MPPDNELAAKEVPKSPQLLSQWWCGKHLELRDALEMGDPLIVVEAHSASGCRVVRRCRGCQVQHDEEWQEREREFGMECWRVESAKPPHPGPPPAVDGSVLTSVFVRIAFKDSSWE